MVANKRSRNPSRSVLPFLSLVFAVSLTLPVIALAQAGPGESPTLAPAPTWELNDLRGEAHRLDGLKIHEEIDVAVVTEVPCGRRAKDFETANVVV